MPNLGILITNFFLKKNKLHAVAIHTDGYILQISKMFFLRTWIKAKQLHMLNDVQKWDFYCMPKLGKGL